MLPKSRIAAVLSIGLGLALILWAVLAPSWIHNEPKMPLDLEHSTFTLRDEDATARLVSGEIVTGPVERQSHMEVLPPADGDVATLRVGVTDTRMGEGEDLERLLQAAVWSLTINRATGAVEGEPHVTDQLASPTRAVAINGPWLKFPADAQQTTYDAFDVTLRDVVPAVFEESYSRGGREIYVYRQQIDPVNVAQKYPSFANTAQLKNPEGEERQAYLFHSGTRDIHVDQVSGMVVNIVENITDYYGDAEGNKWQDALVFNGEMADADVDAMISQAAGVSDGSTARLINYIVLAVGSLLTLVGLLVAFGVIGGRRKVADRDEAEA